MSAPSLAPIGFVSPREDIRRAIAYTCVSVVLGAMLNVGLKLLSNDYPAVELTFLRCLFGFVPVLFVVRGGGGVRSLHTNRPGRHVVRAAFWSGSFLLSFLSLKFLPLAEAVSLSFLAPIFMTALSVPMLGERVGIHRWSAVIVGFVGVLFMTRPNGEFLQLGTIFGIGSALCSALGALSVRQLSRTETTAAITCYMHVFAALMLAVALPFAWTTPTWQASLMIVAIGLLGGTGQYLSTRSLGCAPAAVLAPFNYSQIIWAVILGYVIWGDLPDLSLAVGVALVIASGIYICIREMHWRRLTTHAQMAAED
ncbi:MAG TPA: DMT family transporter [Stellaceae bacterium]|nr:DMT family transporter [Stellaceae bacterium]